MSFLLTRFVFIPPCIVLGLLIAVSGCGEAEDSLQSDLRERGVLFTIDDRGQVSGLYLYSNKERTFTDEDLEFLKEYPATKVLLIESSKLTDAALKHIATLPNLEELDLTFCRGERGDDDKFTGGITDAAMFDLKSMTHLQRLGLQATRVTDKAVDRLQQALPNCKIDFNYSDGILAAMALQRQRGEQDADFVTTVQKLGAEVEFDDDLNPIDLKLGTSDLALRHIGKTTTLKSLTLRGGFTGEGLAFLADLPQLESLDIADPFGRRTIGKAAMATLVSFKMLKSLDLSGNQFSDDELKVLKMLTELESLRLIGCLLTDRAIQQLKESMPKCKISYSNDPLLNAILNGGGDIAAAVEEIAEKVERNDEGTLIGAEFRLSHISDSGLAKLKELDKLEWLHFVYCRRISDEGMRYVGQLANLKDLTLSYTNVGNRGIAKIAALSKLESLDLSTSRVGSRASRQLDDSSMRDIAVLKQLKHLSLSGTGLSDPGLRRLEGLKNLETIDVRKTQVTPDGLRRFKQKLPNCDVNF